MEINNNIDALSWEEACPIVEELLPELARIINEISPSKDYVLYKIRYPYGAEILKKGLFQLPDNDEIVPLTEANVSEQVKNDLSYNAMSNPMMLVLNNSAELYLAWNERIIPFTLMQKGYLLGAWGVLDNPISHHPPVSIWDMSSGARSIFFLPKISDQTFHNRLVRELQLEASVPKTLNEQWNVFKEIANHQQVEQHWYTEILCFSFKWFADLDDKSWRPFRHFLLNYSWENSSFLRNKIFTDLVFSILREQNKIEPNAYINDIIKTLYAIGTGSVSGFAPAVNDVAAPVSLIQDIYVNGAYKLKKYYPVMMVPTHYVPGKDQSVYFSLNHPTGIEYSLKSTKRSNILHDLVMVSNALNQYRSAILSGKLLFANSIMESVAKDIQFDLFHDRPSQYASIIKSSSEIPLLDSVIGESVSQYSGLHFPANSEYTRGCIRIYLNED